jgi:hypothetical protein
MALGVNAAQRGLHKKTVKYLALTILFSII